MPIRPRLDTPQPPVAGLPRRHFLTTAAALCGASGLLALAGCGGGGSKDQATLRFVNGTVDYAKADIWVGDALAYGGLVNGGGSTGYGSEDSGTLQISLHPAGSSSAVLSASHAFATDSDTTVLAMGSLATNLTFRYLDESNAAAANGTFNVRAFHATPSLGALDIYLSNAGSLSGLAPTLSLDAYDELSAFVGLASGVLRLRITKSGDQGSVLYDYGAGLNVAGTTVLTLAVVPRSSGSLPNVVALPERNSAALFPNDLA